MNSLHTNYALAELIGEVSAARQRAGCGGSPDLTGLPERVEEICKMVNSIPAREAAGYRKALEDLIDGLNHLRDDLTGHHKNLLEQIQPPSRAPKKSKD